MSLCHEGEAGEYEECCERIGPSAHVGDGARVQRMQRPRECSGKRPPSGICAEPHAQQPPQRKRGERVCEHAAEMPSGLRCALHCGEIRAVAGVGRAGLCRRLRGLRARDAPQRIVGHEREALHRSVKIARRRIEEKKLAECIRRETPRADGRVAQDERGVVPHEAVAHGRPVRDESREHDHKNRNQAGWTGHGLRSGKHGARQ